MPPVRTVNGLKHGQKRSERAGDQSTALLLNDSRREQSYRADTPMMMVGTHAGPSSDVDRSRSSSGEKQVKYAFVEQRPNEIPPRGQITKIRQWAMKNYLSSHPSDPRAKRRRGNRTSSLKPGSSPPEEIQATSVPKEELTEILDHEFGDWYQRGIVWDGAPTVIYTPFRSTVEQTIYLAEPMQEMQFIRDGLQGKLNAFNEWPSFDFADGEIERLKHSCSQLFGSVGLSKFWVPILMENKNAFCSTICISAAHDEIMDREHDFRVSLAAQQESCRRTAVRLRLIQMIKLSVIAQDTSNGNIVAVLHVLFSEIMSGEYEMAKTHGDGLGQLVNLRGGLLNLGVNGRLAQTLVVVMMLMSCVLETAPEEMYHAVALNESTEPPKTLAKQLNAPIYSSSAFCSPQGASWEDVSSIMEYTRQATNMFFVVHGMSQTANVSEEQALQGLHKSYRAIQQFATQPLSTQALAKAEAIRIACRLYVHALVHKQPFSKAVLDVNQPSEVSPILQFKQALKHSPFETCWDKSSNVLLWCGVVIMAAANGLLKDSKQGQHEQLRRARDFVAAVALRVAIKQIFGRTLNMLGMLKRLSRIQEVLGWDVSQDETFSLLPLGPPTPQHYIGD